MRGGAVFVAAGIFLSRIFGLVRVRVMAMYLGNSDAADAFSAALKIPNFLQNLFGEGVLSASFIPVYAEFLAKGDQKLAARVASVIFSLLALVVSFFAVLGVLATPFLIDVIAPGFSGEKRDLSIRLVQIFFPGVALLVMSAWCLGVLNSHRRYFLSYVAPVAWNSAIIASLLIYGGKESQFALAETAAWGLVIGSALQFLMQFPVAIRLVKEFRPSLSLGALGVATVITSFVPIVFSRGVVQVNAYVDNILASLLPSGAVAIVSYAQTLSLLPVSLFGMSVAAVGLSEMSQTVGSWEKVRESLQDQVRRGQEKIIYFVVPTVVMFLGLGDVIVSAIFQVGVFGEQDTKMVWAVLAANSLGLVASTRARLIASSFYALKDPKTPLRFSLVRVGLAMTLGFVFALYGPGWLGVEPIWGIVGLGLASGISGWVEFFFLRQKLESRLGSVQANARRLISVWTCALLALAVALILRYLLIYFGVDFQETETLPGWVMRALRAALFVGVYGLVYRITCKKM